MTPIVKTLQLIAKEIKRFPVPSVTVVSFSKDPYLVLISCILSLRTKDKTTEEAGSRLFHMARTPEKMLQIPESMIEKLIFPVGFYRNKAKVILEISKRIIEDFKGLVPDNLEDLLSLKGVGLKTANLVLGLGFKVPAICVDTHVHRISNRLGWIKTKTPEQSEAALRAVVPQKYWIELNTILVTFGQNLCLPISPFCSRCPVKQLCRRVGVKTHR